VKIIPYRVLKPLLLIEVWMGLNIETDNKIKREKNFNEFHKRNKQLS